MLMGRFNEIQPEKSLTHTCVSESNEEAAIYNN